MTCLSKTNAIFLINGHELSKNQLSNNNKLMNNQIKVSIYFEAAWCM